MVRTEVVYGGQAYTVGRPVKEVCDDIMRILSGGRAGWLEVRDGSPGPIQLLIHPGVVVAVSEIGGDADPPDHS
jgi:hypothetical protein